MYKIIKKSGELVGYTEEPIYIRKHPNGCYVQTSQETAEGISYKSTPYSIGGLDGADEVLVVKQDADDIYMDIKTAQEQFALADNTAIELYEMQMAQEQINAAQDDALVEIYEMIGG